jgi:CheY-like chemotaxis protein
MRVLIVDDSRATQTIIHRQIQGLGYHDIEYQKADNGQAALNIIRTWEPSLIISDWHMPEMSGIELLATLKQEMLGVTFGFITSETSRERLQEAKDYGAQFIIQKPFDSQILKQTLEPFFNAYHPPHSKPNSSDKDSHIKKHIILPHLSKLQERLNTFANMRVTLTQAPPVIMEKQFFPFLVGLYSNKDKASVHAIAIADIRTIGIFARLTSSISQENIHHTITTHKVSQQTLSQGHRVLQFIANTLYNTEVSEPLILRDAKLLKTPAEHIQKMLDTNKNHRLDTQISIPELQPGHLTIIVS